MIILYILTYLTEQIGKKYKYQLSVLSNSRINNDGAYCKRCKRYFVTHAIICYNLSDA